jgi:hypothetical protein
MTIKAAVFTGPTNLVAMGHPFVRPGHTDTPGVPLAIDIHTRELICMDPWLLKNAGVISSAFGLILGPKGHGKSSTMKIIDLRLMMIAAGYQMMRVAINDYKPEGKASEYQKLTEACRSIAFAIAHSSINPFEAQLFMSAANNVYELGILGIAKMFCEFAKESRLTGDEGTALRVALHAMLKYDPANWTPHTLYKLLRSITDDQIMAYNLDLDKKLQGQLEARLERVTDKNQKLLVTTEIRDIVGAQDNGSNASVRRAGIYVSTLLARVLFDSYGSMFGGAQSYYKMITQRAVTKDWRGVEPEAETLMRLFDTHVKISAIENNRLDLIPHIELDDEKHKSMGNLQYARSHSYESEIARGIHTCNLSATHRLGSIRQGAVGSELYNLGNTIISNLGFVIIGQQNDQPEILDEIQSRYSLSNSDTRQLTTLPDYVFGFKVGEQEPLRYGRVFATPKELEILGSNAATDRMIDRPDILNPEEIERFARENGVTYLGEVA